MTMPDNGPMFAPDFFVTGYGCAWKHEFAEPLSMNEWFIAGPGPGVPQEAWLKAAQAYRANVLAGKDRYLSMHSHGGHGWLRFVPALEEAFALRTGDSLFLAITARSVEGKARLALTLDCSRDASCEPVLLGHIDIPDDGEWHELSASITIPEVPPDIVVPGPKLVVESREPGASARADLAGVIMGLDDPVRMNAFGQMLRTLETTHVCRCIYEREDLAWTQSAFSCYFLFMYDRRIWSPEQGYRVDEFMQTMQERFGGLESVILWPAYPRIGVDDRNQFDFFRDLPGGLDAVRQVCRDFQGHGVRVLIPWLPWDTGTRREGISDEAALAEMLVELEADGIHLDTLTSATTLLRQTVDARREGIALVPELGPPARQLSLCNISWAQWPHDPNPPGMPHLKWVEPRHVQHFTRRWNTCHRDEIETAFFNGTGLLLWENIFGTHNPVSEEDAALWKRAAAVLRAYPEVFASTLWDPFYPSVQEEVYIHRWPGAPSTLFTLRNLGEPIAHGPLLRWQLPQHVRADDMYVHDLWTGKKMRWDMTEFGTVQVWGDLDTLGCIAVTFGNDPRMERLLEAQAGVNRPSEKRASAPEWPVPLSRPGKTAPWASGGNMPEGMVLVPGGTHTLRLEHQRRECGCYADPDAPEERKAHFVFGCPHDEMIQHDYAVELADFLADEAQVSNAEFNRFLQETGYRPEHPENFLRHWNNGVMPDEIADLPVVYVDLDDARAYAQWAGKRLPTEAEWQRAAQGDDGRIWPWGGEFDPAKCASAATGPMPVRSLPEGRGPHGLYHTTGNVWEWTESEYGDGHTRFCIIRGGSWYRPSGSGWYVDGGPQPLNTHTKFLLLWPGLDRCATIGFRCVKDVK